MRIECSKEIWYEARAELQKRLGSDRYERWLAPLSVLSAAGDEIRLGAPNKFCIEWIEERYLRDVADVLARKAGRALRVTLGIDPELYRKMRKSQEEILAGVPALEGPASLQGPLLPASPRDRDAFPFPPAAKGWPGGKVGGAAEPQTLENFVLGPSNRMAHAAAIRVAEEPGLHYNPLFIHGGCGLGKTHLLKGIHHGLRKRHPGLAVRFLTGEEFLNQFVASLHSGGIERFRTRCRTAQVLVIDDVHMLGNKNKTQEEFLHTFNALTDGGCQIVLSSDCHPREIENLREALQGRFLSGLVAVVERPDFETRLEILRQRSLRARVPLEPDLLRLIAETIRSSVRELIGASILLEGHCLQAGSPPDLIEARRLLERNLLAKRRRIGLPAIVDRVARHFGIPVDRLLSPSRQRSLTVARQVAMYLGRRYTEHSLAEIGEYFGGRNHTSAKVAEDRIEILRRDDPTLTKEIETIIDSLED